MSKPIYDIYFVKFNNKDYMMSKVNGRIYKREINHMMHPKKQCDDFIDYIVNEENRILANESNDFYDYMFRRLERGDY